MADQSRNNNSFTTTPDPSTNVDSGVQTQKEGSPASEHRPRDDVSTKFVVSNSQSTATRLFPRTPITARESEKSSTTLLYDKLECSVCSCYCADLVKLKKCGHVFCRSCLEQHLLTCVCEYRYCRCEKKTCPQCRDRETDYESYFAPEVQPFTTDLLIGYCSSCDWKGTYGEYRSGEHHIKCPNLKPHLLSVVTDRSVGNDFVYSGGWQRGKPEGKGTSTSGPSHKDKHNYTGEWKDDKMNGRGTYTSSLGAKYEGEWKEGKQHGHGTYTYSNGAEYVGEWKEDELHGQGTFKFTDGAEYNGEWMDDKMHGQGTFKYASGSKYVGQWENDKKHGQGTFMRSDGAKYDGEWKEGKRHGHGSYADSDGDKYVGQWENDKRHGRGLLINSERFVLFDGQWIQGRQGSAPTTVLTTRSKRGRNLEDPTD